MYLFQRFLTLRGGPRRSLPWAIEMNEFVNRNSDLAPTLWAGRFGYPLGAVAWGARVESRAALAGGMDKLMANDAYHDLIDTGQEFIAEPGEDHLRQLIHPEALPEDLPPVDAVAEMTSAVPAEGKLGAAMGWGVEIATMYAEITGAQAAFYADAYGHFGQLTWIAVHADMAAADAANDATNTNSDYLAAIDGAGDLFVPMSGTRAMATRIA